MKYETYIDEELHEHALREEMKSFTEEERLLFHTILGISCGMIKDKLSSDELSNEFYMWAFGPSHDDFDIEQLPVFWNKLHGEEYWVQNLKFFIIDFRVFFVMWLKMKVKEKEEKD
jgi:hypothetical protein